MSSSFMVLSGCAPAAVAGGGVAAIGVFAERRGPQTFLDDNVIAIRIRSSYFESEMVGADHINVTVFRGHVILTGGAVTQHEMDEAVRIAKSIPGVSKVSSEIKLQALTAQDLMLDSGLTNQIKILLLKDEIVRGLDFHVETTKQIVYLVGLANSVAERDRAIEIARSVPGVAQVVSFVEVDPTTKKHGNGQ